MGRIGDFLKQNNNLGELDQYRNLDPIGYRDDFNKYDVSLSKYIDQYDNRAANQTNTEAFGNAAVQAVAEVVGGTIEGIGYLGDLPQHLNLLKGTEQEFGNWFSDIGKGIKEASRQSNPIYGGDGFDPLSPRWWAKNMPSIASSLSLLIPAAGTVKGLSLLGKATKLSKLTKGINIAKGTTLNSALKGTTGAVLSRYMEATMEASGQFDEAFKRNIQKGLSEEDAKLAAGKEASKVWYANQALLLTDLPQYFMHFNPISNKFAQFGWQAFTEGVEEGLQYGINKEAKDSKNVLSVYGNIIQNFPEYFDDPEFLTSVTMGAIGGAVFSIPSLLKRQKDKDKFRENIQKLQEIKKAEAEGDLTKVQAIKDKDLSTMSVDELSSMKELSQDEEQIKVIDEIINIKTQAKATSSVDDKANKLAELKLNKDNLKKSKERLVQDSYFNEVYNNYVKIAENAVTKEEFIDGIINQDFSSEKSKEFKKYVLDILKKDKIENNGNLNRTVESIKEVQDNINENIDEITKIVNDPDEFLDKKQEEKLQEMLNKPVKELFDYAIEDEDAEFAAVQKAQEILDQAEDVKENYEDVKEFIEDQEGGEVLASQLAAIKEGKAVEVPRQENPDPQLDTINKIQSQLTTPANKKQARSMSKGYGEKTINILGKANPLKGLTQDFRVRFNKEFKNNKEVQDQFRKELSEAKTAEQLIAVNNKYSGVEFQTKFKLTPEEHAFLEPLLKSFDVTKQEYRNVIYNIYKYLDKPLTFESYIYTNDDGSTGMGYAYVLDGKYPIALAPSINTLIKNLKDKNILSNEVLDEDGYLVSGTFKYDNVEQDFYDLQNLYKYGGEVNFLRDTSGEIVYQKGQYNNQEEFRTLSDITEDALITTVGANGELLFNKEKPSDFDLNVRSDQNKVKGWFYLVQKDTAGKYRLNRVYTKRLVDHQESFEELKRILQIAQDASKFFKGKVNKTLRGVELSEKMLEVLDNYEDKNDPLFKNAQTWFRDYSDLSKKVINEIAQTKEKNVYLDKALIFYFTDKDGIFNPITFLKSKGVFKTSAKTLEELTPETIEESIPVQIKVNNLKNTPFREIADKLITNAKDINQPFASPTFFFDIIPNNERQETNQKEQTQEQKREEIQQERSQETTEIEPVVLSNKNFRIIKIDNELVYQYKRGLKWIEYKNTNAAINRAKEQFGIDYEMVLAPQSKTKDVNNIIEEVKQNSSFIKLSKDGTHYINTKTGKKYTRVTSYITDEEVKENAYLKSAQIIGTAVDNFVRDYFNGNLKIDEYNVAPNSQLSKLKDQLDEVSKKLEKRKEVVIANNVILYNDDLGIAGEVDLLTYDKDGNIRIYDVKTMRGNNFTQSYSGDSKNKYESTRYGKSKKQKHTEQLSMYRILLNNTHGLLAKTIGIMPIEVFYDPGDTISHRLELLKGVQLEPLNKVKEARLNQTSTKEPYLTPDQQLALDKMQELYPEIKIGFTQDGKSFEVGDGKVVMNQEKANKVSYNLKSVNILSSDRAKQVFKKGKKNNWDLNKILTELQIPKEQKQIILDKGLSNDSKTVEDLIESGEITYTDENGNLCAKMGSRSSKFTKGSQWELVKDLRGYPSHAQGGVDIKLDKDGFSFARGEVQITAAHGLVLSKIK